MINVIDHIVIGVRDISETQKFYSMFLGEPISLSEDSLVYQIGNTKLFLVLPEKDFILHDKDSGSLNHIAFGSSTLEELKDLNDKLNSAGILNSGIQIDKYGGKEFVWFDDPNGNRLEFYLRHA